jgi:alkaline phosphatase
MSRRGALAALLLAAGMLTAAPQARNVILMIPDGCDLSLVTLARWYSGRPLALDALLCGGVKTSADNSIITESAAAATAYATGYKTSCGFLGMGPGPDRRLRVAPLTPDSLAHRPLVTLLEAARLQGKSTGLVVTSIFPHATPACFAAHVPDREDYDEIAKQMVYQKIDVVFGGGLGWLEPKSRGGLREDSLDLKKVLNGRGCRLVSSSAEMAAVHAVPVWGLFAEKDMRPDADRSVQAPTEPSLAAMTAKAIALLSANPEGFFLMVEGSQVDWGDHANDPFYAVTDFLAFDSAVRVAMDFAACDSHTLVISCPDHNCGGLSIGSGTSPVVYDSTSLSNLLDPLRRMKLTSTGVIRELGSDSTPESIRERVRRWWGVTLADSELAEVGRLRGQGMELDHALSEVFSRHHTLLGWTSHGHTGEDVPLWAYGPGRPTGVIDNTDIARTAAHAADLDLTAAGRELFSDLGMPGRDSGLGFDISGSRDPVLIVGGARLPIGTDLFVAGSETTRLHGITVYSSGSGHAYGPAAIRDRAPRAEARMPEEGPQR